MTDTTTAAACQAEWTQPYKEEYGDLTWAAQAGNWELNLMEEGPVLFEVGGIEAYCPFGYGEESRRYYLNMGIVALALAEKLSGKRYAVDVERVDFAPVEDGGGATLAVTSGNLQIDYDTEDGPVLFELDGNLAYPLGNDAKVAANLAAVCFKYAEGDLPVAVASDN